MQPKLFIATPMYGGQCYGAYQQGMLHLTDICRQLNWPTSVSMMFNESLITRARNAMVANFLKSDCTHMFFIDSDIRFNAAEIPPMIYADKDIICGIYPKKEINWHAVAQAVKDGVPPERLKFHSGSFVVNLVNYEGSTQVPINEPVEIWNGGTGFMLIKRDVFARMRPACASYKNDVVDQSGNIGQGEEIVEYFDTSIEVGHQRLLSEDYHFCHVWRTRCGGKVYAAPWVTLAHNGSYAFEGQLIRHERDQPPEEPKPEIRVTRSKRKKVKTKSAQSAKQRKPKNTSGKSGDGSPSKNIDSAK